MPTVTKEAQMKLRQLASHAHLNSTKTESFDEYKANIHLDRLEAESIHIMREVMAC